MFLTLNLLSRVLVFVLALVYCSVLAEFINIDSLPSMISVDIQALLLSAGVGYLCYLLFVKAKY